LEWLTARSPDVVVTPEWRDNSSGDVLRRGLEARGLQVATATPSKRANGILLAAKRPFQFRCGTPLGAMNGDDCRGLRIRMPDAGGLFPPRQGEGSLLQVLHGRSTGSPQHSICSAAGHLSDLKPERSASACSSRSATRTKRKDRRWAGDCRDP